MSDKHQHARQLGEKHAVTPLELFFDLVFVFALTQVTTLMADDLTWLGVLRGFAVLSAVWWAWAAYAWLTNTIDIDDDMLSRLVILVAMASMLVAGLAVPQAFGEYAALFGVAYFVVRLLHVVLYAVIARDDPDVLGAVRRLAPGLIGAATLIVVAGFVPAGPARAALWVVALLIDYLSPLLSGTTGWKLDVGHFVERHGLIIIIALGESMVALGVSAAGETLTPGVIVATSLGIVVISAMWWLYFDVVAIAAERRLESLSGAEQTATARDSYTYIHVLMVFGIVLVALGLKKTLLAIDDPLKVVAEVALLGGLALYLLAHVAFRLRNIRTLNVQRLIAALLLLALIPVGTLMTSLALLAIVTVVMVVLVGYEVIRFREGRHNLRHHVDEHP
jgi:low temperature requirement protein LtrA